MENIYNLLPQERKYAKKQPRYTSNYRESVLKDEKENKYKFKTMGPANHPRPVPSQFLRARESENIPKSTILEIDHKCCFKKPKLPIYDKNSGVRDKPDVDFIQLNKKIVQTTTSKVFDPAIVDTSTGDRYLLHDSGLMKQYIYKKDFGSVPAYIRTRQIEKTKTARLQQIYQNEKDQDKQLPMLTAEQREKLISALKERHQQVYGDFQRLSVTIDTIYKRQKKVFLEKQLNELEADIRTIQDHGIIFIEK